MRVQLLRIYSMIAALAVAIPIAGEAQKHTKKRHAVHNRHTTKRASIPVTQPVNLSQPVASEPMPIPQESSFKPEMKQTKKVMIVPAPPPPPGREGVPKY